MHTTNTREPRVREPRVTDWVLIIKDILAKEGIDISEHEPKGNSTVTSAKSGRSTNIFTWLLIILAVIVFFGLISK